MIKILNKTLSSTALTAALLIMFIAGLFIANRYWSSEENTFNGRLETRIANGDEKIPINELTDFEWERVFVFKATYLKEELEEIIGFKYEGQIPEVFCDPEQRADLVFIKSRKAKILPLPYCEIETSCPQVTSITWASECNDSAFLFLKEMKSTDNQKYHILKIQEKAKDLF